MVTATQIPICATIVAKSSRSQFHLRQVTGVRGLLRLHFWRRHERLLLRGIYLGESKALPGPALVGEKRSLAAVNRSQAGDGRSRIKTVNTGYQLRWQHN